MAGVTLDAAGLEAVITRAAMKGAQRGAQYALERIRTRAPKRKLFKGTQFSRGESFQAGGIPSRGIAPQTFQGKQPKVRRIKYKNSIGLNTEVRGHANSAMPVLRTRDSHGGERVITGNFRKVGALGLQDIDVDIVRGGKLRGPAIHETDEQKLARAEHVRTKALTVGGRYEARNERARYKGQVGGRLAGELHIEGGQFEGSTLWWYVVSRTKDRGRLYGRDMEYGNRHNRAYPFMRPGLHESRGNFTNEVRREIEEAARKR